MLSVATTIFSSCYFVILQIIVIHNEGSVEGISVIAQILSFHATASRATYGYKVNYEFE